MHGTFDVRAQILVSRNAIGLNTTGEPLAFSDVPIITLTKGAMWNGDLVLGTEEEREWCNAVHFSHHNLYPRGESKCLIVSLKEMTKFCFSNKTMRRAMDTYAKIFRHQRRTSVYHVLSYLCKPDFQSKV